MPLKFTVLLTALPPTGGPTVSGDGQVVSGPSTPLFTPAKAT
jgi:hypothetical protein